MRDKPIIVRVNREMLEDTPEKVLLVLKAAGIPISHTFDIDGLFCVTSGTLNKFYDDITGENILRWTP